MLSDKWMENFGKWEPANQMIFSCAVLLAGFVLVVLTGMWVLGLWRSLWDGLGVCIKGYPPPEPEDDEEDDKPKEFAELNAILHKLRTQVGVPAEEEEPGPKTPPVSEGLDWKEEQRRIAEEAEFQAKQQEELQATVGKIVDEVCRRAAFEPPQAKPDVTQLAADVAAINGMLLKLASTLDPPPAPEDLKPFLHKCAEVEAICGRAADACDNPLNPTGHCLKEGGCKNAAECRHEVAQFIDPDPHATLPLPHTGTSVVISVPTMTVTKVIDENWPIPAGLDLSPGQSLWDAAATTDTVHERKPA